MKKISQKALSLVLSAAMLFGMVQTASITAFAATDSGDKDSGVPRLTAIRGGSQTELYLDSGNIVIKNDSVTVGGEAVDTNENGYIITQKDGNTAIGKTVSVQIGTPIITLKDVNIDVSGTENACAFSIAKGAEVNLTLSGNNILKSGKNRAGLEVPGDKDVPDDSTKNATLTIKGSSADSLTATGAQFGTGIGGGCESAGGTITITGGTVTANGGSNSAGIGGGGGSYSANVGSGGSISISGGTVTANGGSCGAGIGGGGSFYNGGAGGSISVSGGTVTANGGYSGAGIGGGGTRYNGGIGGTVSITGTNTKVITKDIGSGSGNTEGGSLTVGDADTADGPTVELQSAGTNAATTFKNCFITGSGAGDLAGLYDADGNKTLPLNISKASITIGDGTVTGSDCTGNAASVSSGNSYAIMGTSTLNTISVTNGTANITLMGVNIDVSGTGNACAFSIAKGAKVNLTLSGKNILKSGKNRAGLEALGDKDAPDDSTKNALLTIIGSSADSLTANGGYYGAGIGGGLQGAGGSINVSGGTVIATSGDSGAGIGGGYHGAGGTVTVSGGTVTATGSDGGAGIGGGIYGAGGSINVNGGTVTATGGNSGAGIGGGNSGAGGSINVSSGTVTATGGKWSAGIGGGYKGAGGTVTITGTNAKVTAKGQDGGKDIGSGADNTEGGSLTVGDADTAGGPTVELQSAGTNAAATFKNCMILGTGAKNKDGTDVKGAYDANGKIRLNVLFTAIPKSSALFGNPITLTATLTRFGFGDTVALKGNISFKADDTAIASSIPDKDGKAQAEYTPTDGQTHILKAVYTPAEQENYAVSTATVEYSADKKACAVKTAPMASNLYIGSKLSTSAISSGEITNTDGTTVTGSFAWANPNTAVSASGEFEAVFIADDSALYNTVSVMVSVTATEKPNNDNHSNHHSGNQKTSTSSAGSNSSTVTTTSTPAGGTVTTVATKADTTPTVQGNKATVTATVPASAASAITSATAKKPAQLNIMALASPILEQLNNPVVQTVEVDIKVPAAIINNTNPNAGISVTVEQATLQAAKDAKKDVVFKVINEQTGKTAYSWSFRGTDLAASSALVKNIDLAMKVMLTTEVAAVNAVTPASKGIVLGFANNRILPAAATIKVYVGDKGYTPGQSLYFYYYNPSTKQLESIGGSAYTVDAGGYVTVSITHCSDYVLLPQKLSAKLILDTKGYVLTLKDVYTMRASLIGADAKNLKVYSSNSGILSVYPLNNGLLYRINGIKSGTASLIFEVYGAKGKLLTKSVVPIAVQKSGKSHGDSTRVKSVF